MDMTLVCDAAGLLPLIPTKRIRDIMVRPHSVWMMEEGSIDYNVRWGFIMANFCEGE